MLWLRTTAIGCVEQKLNVLISALKVTCHCGGPYCRHLQRHSFLSSTPVTICMVTSFMTQPLISLTIQDWSIEEQNVSSKVSFSQLKVIFKTKKLRFTVSQLKTAHPISIPSMLHDLSRVGSDMASHAGAPREE